MNGHTTTSKFPSDSGCLVPSQELSCRIVIAEDTRAAFNPCKGFCRFCQSLLLKANQSKEVGFVYVDISDYWAVVDDKLWHLNTIAVVKTLN